MAAVTAGAMVAAGLSASAQARAVKRIPNADRSGVVLSNDGEQWEWVDAPAIDTPTKCPCCGSREFTPRNGRQVCLYCRSGQ